MYSRKRLKLGDPEVVHSQLLFIYVMSCSAMIVRLYLSISLLYFPFPSSSALLFGTLTNAGTTTLFRFRNACMFVSLIQ